MSNISKIREAVNVLSTMTDEEWKELEKALSTKSEITPETPKPQSFEEEKKVISEVLKQIGMPMNIKGYFYMRESILLAIQDSDKYSYITKELYPEIAKRFKTTASRVERAIRHSIEVAWERGDIDVIYEIFGYSVNAQRGKPTNSEAISALAEYIKMYKL